MKVLSNKIWGFMVFLYHSNGIIDCSEEEGGKLLNMEALGGMVSSFMSEPSSLMRLASESQVEAGQLESLFSNLSAVAKSALNSASTSQFARENLFVPFYEKVGALKDSFGFDSDFSAVIHRTYMSIQSMQIPLERFAAERFGNKENPDEDIRKLTRLENHPDAKRVLKAFSKSEPERKMAEAAVVLDAFYTDFKDLSAILKRSIENQTLAESLLVNFDMLSSSLSQITSRYIATITRYLLYKDRFPKNKSALLFVSKAVIPRLFRLFAIELNILESLWVSSEEMKATSELAAEDFNAKPEMPNVLAGEELFINFLKTPEPKPYALIRRWCRRVLARVKTQVDDLQAISEAALSCTSLDFQLNFAKALKKLEEGEKPALVFKALREESSCIAAGTPYKPKDTVVKDPTKGSSDDRQNLLDLLNNSRR